MRQAYSFVSTRIPLVLIMDNAGGHGSDEAKLIFIDTLLREYNIVVHWQIPNSPELNLLDLGIWQMIQSDVEKL